MATVGGLDSFARFHFGVRAGPAYLDPSLLFEASRGLLRLVPVAWLRSGLTGEALRRDAGRLPDGSHQVGPA